MRDTLIINVATQNGNSLNRVVIVFSSWNDLLEGLIRVVRNMIDKQIVYLS